MNQLQTISSQTSKPLLGDKVPNLASTELLVTTMFKSVLLLFFSFNVENCKTTQIRDASSFPTAPTKIV